MVSAAEAKAASFGVAYNVAVVDAGGHLLAFARQDGALIGSIELAINKAITARILEKATHDLAALAQSGKPLFGIHGSNDGKIVIFGGACPSSSTETWSAQSAQAPGPSSRTFQSRRRLSPHLVIVAIRYGDSTACTSVERRKLRYNGGAGLQIWPLP